MVRKQLSFVKIFLLVILQEHKKNIKNIKRSFYC